MKKSVYRFIIAITFTAICILCYELSYTPFTPLKFDNQRGLVELKVEQGFYERLAQVLPEYDVSFKKDGTQIYVKRYVLHDKELIWNYTSKALDDSWLKSAPHGYLNRQTK